MPADASESILERFHPVLAGWFQKRFGRPTEIQEKAWRLIADGEHCLISAATGSGKTLAAFLWSINQLLCGEWELGGTRVLYISPLKALNNDIRRNVLSPLAELKAVFRDEKLDWPEIRVMTRSGDTEQADRRKMLRKPPEILITTPESLNLLLTSNDGRRALLGVRSVILDEIHSVVGSKRGVYLMTAVERLAHLNGEFQRVALSATVKPMETVAAVVGGFFEGRPRPLRLAESSVEKRYQIAVRFPENFDEEANDEDTWAPIVAELKTLVRENRSTLIFVNSRMLCEKIAHRLNLEEATPLAYSHHGSLSKEIRSAVEQRLKQGELKAIVATNSLEMGIDVGALDCVVMVQSPNRISSAIQKVGRAGHQVGAVSRAVVFPSHSRDFLESAVLSEAIRERDIEAVQPVERPLDVLAQVIVSTLGAGPWDIDELFALVRSCYCYRELTREQFDLVLNMLAGRYAESRLRELKPRISISRSENTVTLRKGALMAFYFSGGVIPDRGYFHLRLTGNGARLGELDEEFVWERSIGDVFTLGVQSWKIERITYNDVFVVPAEAGEMAPPFWRAERYNRDFHFAERIGSFLEWANDRLDEKAFPQELESRFELNAAAAESLARFLRSQKVVTRSSLPHRHHLLAELIDAAPSGAPGKQLVLHTHWGGRVNRPFALALDAAWNETMGHRTEIYVNDDCVVLMLSEGVTIEEVLPLVTAGNVESWLRKRLEGSGFFGARFREAAGNALLVTRNRAGQRLPLWLSRLRAKKLFESVQRFGDFPLLLEAWRTCLKDEFDMDALKLVLAELEDGEIEISQAHLSVASPFASSVAWRQINDEYMYATDDPNSDGRSSLKEDLVRSIAFDESARPKVSKDLIREFEAKRQRTAAGYEPGDVLEMLEWLRDRVALLESDWEGLLRASQLEGHDQFVSKTVRLKVGSETWIAHEDEREKAEALFGDLPDADVFIEWLSYFGPISLESAQGSLACSGERLMAMLDALADERRLVVGELVEGERGLYVCEAENYETLLRMNRARNRPRFSALPLEDLPLFLAQWQGLVTPEEGVRSVRDALDRLWGMSFGIEDWEKSILPVRVKNYHPALLDSVLLEDEMRWRGFGEGKVCFALEDDWDLFVESGEGSELDEAEGQVLARLASGQRLSFAKLQETLEMPSRELESSLWGLVWKGRVSNDAFATARRGVGGGFALCERSAQPERRTRRQRLGRRSSAIRTVTYPGAWYVLPDVEDEGDPVERLELQRERARLLLDRYGVVFKEILQREANGFRWRDVFKALRLLELSGEAIGGRFFEGVPGLQFASKAAFRALLKDLPRSALYWLSAADPASVCGLGLLGGGASTMPARRAGTVLAYRGSTLALESSRGGKSLRIHLPLDDPDLTSVFAMLESMWGLGRAGVSRVLVEEINGEDARLSPYLEGLGSVLKLHSDHKRVVVEGGFS
ncbi:DEAD/DEAH box helicase [Pelagicoccus sp. SDUM812003]|uniref:DEAD/DEAH box helicase n=1 Tax=Pelagicoccus sp. SDUM812003 TaxID=3041267 RepID=UPI00280D89B2|nr:DEAD/DEAH box helicase [Pelagicoccus sp. SDUM812003]MDQ8202728.1 DEAD/DEAH box helicase [Pelagicoccus sp. SDUM812003]